MKLNELFILLAGTAFLTLALISYLVSNFIRW
jgi:hypothetical protein